MTNLINSPIFVAVFMGSVTILCIWWARKNEKGDDVWEHIHKKADTKAVYASINKKVDKDIYDSFAQRIGRQVDKQDEKIDSVAKGVAFIVGKMDGDYKKLTGD